MDALQIAHRKVQFSQAPKVMKNLFIDEKLLSIRKV